MPYKSDKQRRFMHAQHPEIAARWDAEIRRKRKKGQVSKGRIVAALAEHPFSAGVGGSIIGGAVTNQIPKVDWRKKKQQPGRLQPVPGAMKPRKPRQPGTVTKAWKPPNDDPFFKQEAARKTFDLVMKMDDDSAEMFCRIVASDLLEQEIEKNQGTLQRHLNEVVAKQLADTKAAMLRVVAKGESTDAVAY